MGELHGSQKWRNAPLSKRPETPMHLRYCGTKTPDKFLLETAFQFVREMIEPESDLRNYFRDGIVRLPKTHSSPSRARVGAGERWIKLFSKYDGDECIVYPFSTAASRGVLVFNFKSMEAHRAMCLMANKLPPEPKMMALHRCGNGHLGCVTPKHLYWGTNSQNTSDAHRHKAEGKPECSRSNPLRKAKQKAA